MIPLEFTVAILAGLTIPLFVHASLPIWALFVTWGGTFLLGKPNPEGIKAMTPPLIAGTIFGAIFLGLLFTIDPIAGSNAELANILLLALVVVVVMYLGKIPALAVIPAMFFGFACMVGVAFVMKAGSVQELMAPWIYATVAVLLGPVFAWLSIVFTFPSGS